MPNKLDYSIISRIQQANDIVDVVSEHVSLTRKGREMVGLCPFHDDHKPSMNVSPQKQIFKCFACGAGGNVFQFLQLRENLTFGQALRRLADRAGIELPRTRQADTAGDEPSVDPNQLARVNTWAAKFFQQKLFDDVVGKTARDYLNERQLSDESIQTWLIGYAPAGSNELTKTAVKQNIPRDLLVQAGLTTHQGGDKFVNRLMFVIRDVTGRVIGFGGRTLDGIGAKYINSPTTPLFDKSHCLYGLDQARHQIGTSETAVVVEGYTDVIMAHQFGCENVVATLGTSFTEGHARILKRYAKKIVLVFDSDAAGTEAANRALEVCLTTQIDIKIASVPQGKDPCEFLLAQGKDAFDAIIAEATDIFDYKWTRLTRALAKDDSLAGRKAAVEEFLTSVVTAMKQRRLSPIEKGLIINRLSTVLHIDPQQINAQLSRMLRRKTGSTVRHTQNQNVRKLHFGPGAYVGAQQEILEVLLNEPSLFEHVKTHWHDTLFNEPILAEIAAILDSVLRENPDADLAMVLAAVESPQISSAIIQLTEQGRQKQNYQKRLDGAIAAIQRHQREQKKNEIRDIPDKREFLKEFLKHTKHQKQKDAEPNPVKEG